MEDLKNLEVFLPYSRDATGYQSYCQDLSAVILYFILFPLCLLVHLHHMPARGQDWISQTWSYMVGNRHVGAVNGTLVLWEKEPVLLIAEPSL